MINYSNYTADQQLTLEQIRENLEPYLTVALDNELENNQLQIRFDDAKRILGGLAVLNRMLHISFSSHFALERREIEGEVRHSVKKDTIPLLLENCRNGVFSFRLPFSAASQEQKVIRRWWKFTKGNPDKLNDEQRTQYEVELLEATRKDQQNKDSVGTNNGGLCGWVKEYWQGAVFDRRTLEKIIDVFEDMGLFRRTYPTLKDGSRNLKSSIPPTFSHLDIRAMLVLVEMLEEKFLSIKGYGFDLLPDHKGYLSVLFFEAVTGQKFRCYETIEAETEEFCTTEEIFEEEEREEEEQEKINNISQRQEIYDKRRQAKQQELTTQRTWLERKISEIHRAIEAAVRFGGSHLNRIGDYLNQIDQLRPKLIAIIQKQKHIASNKNKIDEYTSIGEVSPGEIGQSSPQSHQTQETQQQEEKPELKPENSEILRVGAGRYFGCFQTIETELDDSLLELQIAKLKQDLPVFGQFAFESESNEYWFNMGRELLMRLEQILTNRIDFSRETC